MGDHVHLGCGNDKLEGFINIDVRQTPAVDRVMNLETPEFPPGSIDIAYSNAFFEHIYRNKRVAHLKAVGNALTQNGFICYIGIPYFPNIAKFYMEQGPGTSNDVFDLDTVYRYTHGDPERNEVYWEEQLHKSLFDKDEVTELLRLANFSSYVIFIYAYPGDKHPAKVNMGFFVTSWKHHYRSMQIKTAKAFLKQFEKKRVLLDTLTFI